MRKLIVVCAVVTMVLAMGVPANAGTVNVGAIGEQGWKSDDTRSNSGTDLVGINNTHAGKPGQTPTAADDTAIANQIQFVDDAPGGVQALKLSWSAGTGSGKATLSTINTDSGFAAGNWQENFSANLRLYRETVTNTTLKIGVQSSLWGTGTGQSQNGFTAIRSGESSWDMVLVYAGDGTTGSWQDISLTSSNSYWNLFDQSGNAFYAPPGNSVSQTLAQWAADATWGDKLFGTGAKVTNVQIGAGSFSVPSIGYVDYLETSLLNGGDRVDFVPEPTTMLLLGLGGLLLRKRKA